MPPAPSPPPSPPVPARTRLLVAKAVVVWAVASMAGVLTALAAFFTGTAALPGGVAHPPIASGPVLRAVVGLGLYLGILAVFALALGLIVRASAAAITIATTITIAVPITLLATGSLGRHADTWWPTEAGRHVLDITQTPGALPPLVGLGYFTTVTLATCAAAVVLVNRRDV